MPTFGQRQCFAAFSKFLPVFITFGPSHSRVSYKRDKNHFVSKALYMVTREPRRTQSLHLYKAFPRNKM